MSLTKVTYSMINGAPANVLDFGAVGDGTTDDTTAIQAALNSGSKYIVFPSGTYKLTSSITIPQNIAVEFDTATIKGHFSDYLIKFAFAGESILRGKLTLTDDDASVVSAATTLTKGIEFGNTASAIHGVDTSGCDIYASKLLTAYYFGEFSYSNVFGVLRAFNCGNSTTSAVLFYAVGLIGPNDVYIQKLEITGSNTATWNGAGLLIQGGFGIGFGQLHIESIYNANGAQFFSCCIDIQSGYFESAGATSTSNTLYVNAGAKVAFNGSLINCPVTLNVRANFIGCRFFKSEIYARADYFGCQWPNANQLQLTLTGLQASDLPSFNGGSTALEFSRFSGNWSEYGQSYAGVVPDFDYFDPNHSMLTSGDTWNSNSLLVTKTATGTYFGAIGFKFNVRYVDAQVYAWAIVKIPSVDGVSEVRVGVGGALGSASFDIDSVSIVQDTLPDEWILVVLPLATVFTSATYSNQAYLIFEGTDEANGKKFLIDSYGVEAGGCTFKNIGTSFTPQSANYLKGTAAPTTGTWAVGQRMQQQTPVVGQPKGWSCTVAGTPGTWVSEGNL